MTAAGEWSTEVRSFFTPKPSLHRRVAMALDGVELRCVSRDTAA
jgi:hypothetical protein